jgi:acyl-CoA thioesterase-2
MPATSFRDVDFLELLTLEPHGPDTYVATTAEYPWGGRLFGGQVVAQALRAAIATVDPTRGVHSLHSYFIRPGTPDEPVRYEVERLRDGRSFSTRQVVARQSSGAILNLSASFQAPEDEADVTIGSIPPGLPGPNDPGVTNHSWGALLERHKVVSPEGNIGYWIRLDADLPDDPLVHVCGVAFMSDAAPSRPARALHPEFAGRENDRHWFQGASLDHAVWFHRPSRADEWHWFDARAHGLSGARGLVTADVYTQGGTHAISIAQQVLLREKRGA